MRLKITQRPLPGSFAIGLRASHSGVVGLGSETQIFAVDTLYPDSLSLWTVGGHQQGPSHTHKVWHSIQVLGEQLIKVSVFQILTLTYWIEHTCSSTSPPVFLGHVSLSLKIYTEQRPNCSACQEGTSSGNASGHPDGTCNEWAEGWETLTCSL